MAISLRPENYTAAAAKNFSSSRNDFIKLVYLYIAITQLCFYYSHLKEVKRKRQERERDGEKKDAESAY